MVGRRIVAVFALALACSCGSVGGRPLADGAAPADGAGAGGRGGTTGGGGAGGSTGAGGTAGAGAIVIRGGIRPLPAAPIGTATVKITKQSLSVPGPTVCSGSTCLVNSSVAP